MTGILNFRLAVAIQFHDTLYGFCTGRGIGTASLEGNMVQQLMEMREEVLYEIFLDIHKAYDFMYRDQCIDALVAYGVGLWAIRLLR